ncbi:hypothetical protein F4823DRAFT_631309 [Ustulina deusta]|nr:hypothetical protein F4823DRAFT_631309 [Ustulina deusta]
MHYPSPPPISGLVKGFIRHNRIKHKDAIPEDQITNLQESCRKIAPPNISQCPLCPWPPDEEAVPDASATLEHIASCIHEFSLNAVSWAKSSDVHSSNTPNDVVQRWLQTIEEAETLNNCEVSMAEEDAETQKVREEPKPVYVPDEYFAESSTRSSQVERESSSSDDNDLDDSLPEVRETYSDDDDDEESLSEDDKQRRGIFDWLSRVPYAPRYNENNKKYQEGTGQWFLVAKLLLNVLNRAADKKKIRQHLDNFPVGSVTYNYTYKSFITHRIKKQERNIPLLAKRALAWIICAIKPLTTSDLQHALAIQPEDCKLNKNNIQKLDTIISVFYRLVNVDKGKKIIRFAHFTARKYFEQSWKDWFENADADITTACLAYLSLGLFSREGACRTFGKHEERLRSNPPYEYAARNWGHHARESLVLDQGVIDFLKDQKAVEASSQVLFGYYDTSRGTTGLHLAAHFGLEKAANALLLDVPYIESKDPHSRTPLSYVAQEGHRSIVERLLRIENVDPDSKDMYNRTPLWLAAQAGHDAIAALRLKRAVDADAENDWGRTPLMIAAKHGA